MSVALFGGTFDPVHFGHLLMAESARQAFAVDVCFVPSGHPPHKKDPATSSTHRLAMLRLAIKGNPHFSISDWEVRQKRVVYTFETLAHFQAEHPREKISFVIGSDSLVDLPMWRESQALLRHYRFLVVERPDTPWNRVPSALRRKVRRVPSITLPFASREIRRQVYESRSIRYQVPAEVDRYIQRHRLYRSAA